MSVRPITLSEEIKAKGHPFVNIFAVFGLTQGLLIYLHRLRIPVQNNWFGPHGSPLGFVLLTVGGYVVGGVIGMAAFTDYPLLRLYKAHRQNKIFNIEGQSVQNFSH